VKIPCSLPSSFHKQNLVLWSLRLLYRYYSFWEVNH
jgi:hypothetical protein